MLNLVRRGEELALRKRREKVAAIAAELRAVLGSAAVEADEARVLVRGRGITKRWLLDPSLRFLAGGLK